MSNRVEMSAWSYIQKVCDELPEAKAWLDKLKLRDYPARDYPGKIACLGSDPNDKHYQHIKAVEILNKLEAAYYSVRKPVSQLIYAKLGLSGLPAPGIEWILGPESGIRELQKRGRTVYQYLYETVPHFESVSNENSFIAAHKFCDRHDENYVEWLDRTTGRSMFYANTGAYFDKVKPMKFDNSLYIPPIHGRYGFLDAKEAEHTGKDSGR